MKNVFAEWGQTTRDPANGFRLSVLLDSGRSARLIHLYNTEEHLRFLLYCFSYRSKSEFLPEKAIILPCKESIRLSDSTFFSGTIDRKETRIYNN